MLVVWRDVATRPRSTRRPRAPEPVVDAGLLTGLDALVASATRRGLHVLLTPTGPGPLWASPCRRGTVADRQACRPAPADFERLVATLGRRYPQVRSWAVWNEPNNSRWLTPQFTSEERPASPAHYRRLVAAAARALRATGHGGDELLAGETAPLGRVTGAPATRPMIPGPFLRALLCRGCRLPGVTGLSHHAYTRGGTQRPRYPSLPGELAVSGLAELTRIAGRLPVHLTEGGWQTTPPDPVFGVPLGRQGEYLNEAEWMVRNRPRVRSFPQYLLHDEVPTGSFQSGLRFAAGDPKPALDAYRLPIWVVRRGRQVTVWGRVRPARAGAPDAVIDRRLPGRRWTAVRTVAARQDVLVRLTSPRAQWRLRWNGATSRTAAEAKR